MLDTDTTETNGRRRQRERLALDFKILLGAVALVSMVASTTGSYFVLRSTVAHIEEAAKAHWDNNNEHLDHVDRFKIEAAAAALTDLRDDLREIDRRQRQIIETLATIKARLIEM